MWTSLPMSQIAISSRLPNVSLHCKMVTIARWSSFRQWEAAWAPQVVLAWPKDNLWKASLSAKHYLGLPKQPNTLTGLKKKLTLLFASLFVFQVILSLQVPNLSFQWLSLATLSQLSSLAALTSLSIKQYSLTTLVTRQSNIVSCKTLQELLNLILLLAKLEESPLPWFALSSILKRQDSTISMLSSCSITHLPTCSRSFCKAFAIALRSPLSNHRSSSLLAMSVFQLNKSSLLRMIRVFQSNMSGVCQTSIAMKLYLNPQDQFWCPMNRL